jgi:hypothetical protein
VQRAWRENQGAGWRIKDHDGKSREQDGSIRFMVGGPGNMLRRSGSMVLRM